MFYHIKNPLCIKKSIVLQKEICMIRKQGKSYQIKRLNF